MISTITNYSNSINALYPISGQDNDSQGFRDNFSNIKQALTNAATEINTLGLKLSPTVQKTLILQNSTGTISGSTLALSSATFSIGQNNVDFNRGNPVLNISGVKYLSINDGSTILVTITSTHKGGSWPYSNAFSVDYPEYVRIGSTFKFYDTDTITYTVLDVNSTTVYVNTLFDPVDLYAHGVSTGTQLKIYNGKLAGSIFQGHNAPVNPYGATGDEKGEMIISPGNVQICTANYDGITKIWTKVNTNIESNNLVVLAPPTISYSDGMSTPNVTCDLSAGTRFYISNPNTDLGVNFINLPPRPCQIEAYVTMNTLTRTDTIKKIWVEGAFIQAQPQELGSISIAGTSTVLTYKDPTPAYGSKFWVSIIATTVTTDVLLIKGIF